MQQGRGCVFQIPPKPLPPDNPPIRKVVCHQVDSDLWFPEYFLQNRPCCCFVRSKHQCLRLLHSLNLQLPSFTVCFQTLRSKGDYMDCLDHCFDHCKDRLVQCDYCNQPQQAISLNLKVLTKPNCSKQPTQGCSLLLVQLHPKLCKGSKQDFQYSHTSACPLSLTLDYRLLFYASRIIVQLFNVNPDGNLSRTQLDLFLSRKPWVILKLILYLMLGIARECEEMTGNLQPPYSATIIKQKENNSGRNQTVEQNKRKGVGGNGSVRNRARDFF